MPVVTSSTAGLYLATSFSTVLVAAMAVVTPNQIEAYTLWGATFAVFLTFLHLRSNNPRMTFMAIGWHVVATGAMGWLLPEPLVGMLMKWGWIHLDNWEFIPKKVWALLALVCGLAGVTLIRFIMRKIEKDGDQMLERVTEVYLPSIKDNAPSETMILRQEVKPAADPPTKK